jgi:ABC-type nitrate/sulfonate/bicarbonate transport system substrate-binding protein
MAARNVDAVARRSASMSIRSIFTVLASVALAAASDARAQSPVPPPLPVAPLRVITFDGGWNLAVWAAQRQGFFEANGVSVQLSYTPTSVALVTGLYDGRYDIALATIDNFIAYQEGQGEAKLAGEPDFAVVMGGDGGFLSVVGGAGVKSFADLKGKTLSVDAMTNGLAFVLRELVARGGVTESEVTFVRAGGTSARYRDLAAGKHDATLLRTPFELLARERGLAVLGTAESLGAYQGTAGAVRRSWAAQHAAALTGFVRGYRAGVAWIYDPANREIVEALLVANTRDMTPALAKRSYDLLLAPKGGIARDAALDMDGIRTVLALRSKYGMPQKTLTDPAKYIDDTYLRAAAAR